IYPPQVKVYELRELSLKFERHLVSEIVDFEVLFDDYSKIAFMCADRSICLHAKYGKVRIPRMGRDMAYDSWSCDLLCAASSTDLYRINLSQGRFLAPLTTQSPGLNVVSRSNLHGLVACGGEDGAVECFDMRARSSVGRINAVAAAEDDGGFQMAVGSSEGKVLIYDLRSSHPIRVKDHMYGSPILDIKWHQTLNSEHPKIISTDNHIVRIWDPETGEGMTSIEPTGGAINDICVIRETGLMLLALDSTHIPSYFIPALGPAPKWCSYLENLTAKSITDPFAYDAYIEKRKKEKLEAMHRERITEYMALHPIAPQKQTALLDEHFEPIMEDEMSEGDASSDDEGRLDKKSRTPRLYEVKDERHAQAFLESVSLANEDALPLGERVAALHDDQRASRLHGDVKVGRGGSREISFVSRSKAKCQEDEDNKDPQLLGGHHSIDISTIWTYQEIQGIISAFQAVSCHLGDLDELDLKVHLRSSLPGVHVQMCKVESQSHLSAGIVYSYYWPGLVLQMTHPRAKCLTLEVKNNMMQNAGLVHEYACQGNKTYSPTRDV
uniref:Nucleolar protein 10-like N-terminal domain-containing protein n=1 Tax=Chenopodium quinoa TaxID=63459 RepID=A0A803LNN5_CHEQI